MKNQTLFIEILLCLLVLVTTWLSFSYGAAGFYPILSLKIFFYKLFSIKASQTPLLEIIWQIRAPRILLCLLVGAGLSGSGAALQATFQNPLVDPYLLGLSAGAGLGCAIAVAFLSGHFISLMAFTGAVLACVLTYYLAKTKRGISRLGLILSGVVVSAFLMALLSLIKFVVDPHDLTSIVTWLMGSFSLSSWARLKEAFPMILIGCTILILMRFRINLLSLSRQEAINLGVNVEKERALVIAGVCLATGASVASAGIIGWVGLMVPHLIRLSIGADNRHLIPMSMVAGAGIMVVSDTIARSLCSFDLPVGIITSLMGIPFFIYLLRRSSQSGWM